MKICATIICLAVTFVLVGCSTPFTYESVEWRVVVDGPENASAFVKYNGIGVNSKNETVRKKAVEELKEFTADKNPDSPFTSELSDAKRKVYTEDNKIIVEETGKISNPLSWFAQTGLNPFTWFDDSINLTVNRTHIIKNVEAASGEIIATSGQVMDEDTFRTILAKQKFIPLELNSDTQWQRHDLEPIDQEIFMNKLQVIIWPQDAKSFYWKFTGSGAGKDWQSLTEEYKTNK